MTTVRLIPTSLAVIAAVAATVATAAAAPLGDPFASVTVSCVAGSAQAPPLTSSHPLSIARISNTSATGSWYTNWGYGSGTSPGDQMFGLSRGALATNDSPRGDLSCPSGSVQIAFFDVPTVPTSYPQSVQNPASSSESLAFVVPSAARFVADIQLTQGAVYVAGAQLASSGTIALGELTSGARSVSVDALDGPAARYTVSIRPLPVAISALDAPVAMRSGAPEALTYAVDGSTTVTITLADAGGVVRKTIASYAVDSGSKSVTFDGHGDSGQLLPDGVYTATVRSNDPYGTTTQESKPVRIDGTPPLIAISPPASPEDSIQVIATDASGVSSVSAGTPSSFYEQSGSYYDIVSATKSTTVAAPFDGWARGSTVQIVVSARDAVGNIAPKTTRSVVIPGGTPAAPVSALSSTPARQKRLTVARRGLRVSGSGSGSVRITVRVPRLTATRLHSRSTTLATKTVIASGGRFSVLVKLSPKVRRAIRRRSRTTLTVSVSGGANATKTVAVVR
jgi:hypothetical protein